MAGNLPKHEKLVEAQKHHDDALTHAHVLANYATLLVPTKDSKNLASMLATEPHMTGEPGSSPPPKGATTWLSSSNGIRFLPPSSSKAKTHLTALRGPSASE